MADKLNGGQIAFRPAWKLSDPMIAEDAKAFWRRLSGLGPDEIERRVTQLCAAAYSEETMIGVATAYLERLEMLRGRFAFFRCLVPPGEHQSAIAQQFAMLSRDLLELWSREQPDEHILGMATAVPVNAYPDRRAEPVWTEGGLNLNLVGYLNSGEQLRVSWFAHARVS